MVMNCDYVEPIFSQRFQDRRDFAFEHRYVASHDGIWQCTFIGECSAVCPKHVDPAGAIQQAKLESTIDWFKEVLWPFGGRKS